MVMKSIISTPGKTTMPIQKPVQQAPTMAPTAPGMGTPNTPAAPVTPAKSWQRGSTGMDRVKTPGAQPYYRPPQPPVGQQPFSGVQSLYRPPGGGQQSTSGGVAPTGDTSTWTAGDWQRYNSFQQNGNAAQSPTWNGKPVQTGAYQPPAWKQPTQPAAPPPAAPPAAPPPAAPPPATTGATAPPPPAGNPVPTIAELADQYPGMPYSWYEAQQQAMALANYSGG